MQSLTCCKLLVTRLELAARIAHAHSECGLCLQWAQQAELDL